MCGITHQYICSDYKSDICMAIYPSDGVVREDYSSVVKSGAAPSIPVLPIGYGDAIHFMRYLLHTPLLVLYMYQPQ